MDGKFEDALTGEQKIRNFNINFGPQHPAAHGVLRLVLELTQSYDYGVYQPILNGVKLLTTNGVIAELVVVLAAVPRSEDCLNGRSRCGVEASLIPERLNRIANEQSTSHKAGR